MKNAEIEIGISNRLCCIEEKVGNRPSSTGTTTIELNSAKNDSGVRIYVQNKGFGFSSSKSVTTFIDNKTARELVEFLQQHLELAEKYDRMCAAANLEGST